MVQRQPSIQSAQLGATTAQAEASSTAAASEARILRASLQAVEQDLAAKATEQSALQA